ncbi:MAG: cupin domain-containing protein [Acidobacteriota bacterium]
MKSGNIYAAIPEHLPEEAAEVLAGASRVRIERIVSDAHSSPEGFWYDQDEGEFVILLEGSAALRFKGEADLRILNPGDWVDIPAHLPHRVEWTDRKRKTVWLAIFYW